MTMPPLETAEVVICGAGIAGVSAAYHLAVRHGVKDVLLVDERPPLSLTSDKSTEGYRNWWPGPGDAVVAFMNRSIDILEELASASGDRFALNRRGYVFATAERERIADFERDAVQAEALGSGPFRYHQGAVADPDYVPARPTGYTDAPEGSDLIVAPALIRRHFPFLGKNTVAVLHVRRAGWLSAQQLGMYLLEESRAHGVRFRTARLDAVDAGGGRIRGVTLTGPHGTRQVSTPRLVVAPGPGLGRIAQLLGVELPVVCERHLKVTFKDTRGALPADAPMLIWTDGVHLPWSADERALLAQSQTARYLLEAFPRGLHARPEGGPGNHHLLLLWAYDTAPVEPTFPLTWDPNLPEIALRGATAMLPGMRAYADRLPRTFVDGGYYVKTPENRPLIGPLEIEGAYVSAAYSGFGIMAACAGGELLAAHVTADPLPGYAQAFLPGRYADPGYLNAFDLDGVAGQL